MAEISGFFDSHLIDGEYDRVYLSEHFAKYFASFIGNGIFGGKSSELIVLEESATMGIKILPGQAWINGYWYENTDELHLAIDIADGVLNRIDSIVVRWNHSERAIRIAVKKGTAATNPIAPSVQRDSDFYELKLADVYVKAGATKITQADIYDKRLNTDVCGLVIGVVQQLDAEEFGIQLNTYITEFIAEHDTWKNATQSDVEQWANDFKTSYANWFTQFKADCDTAVTNLLTENQTKIDTLISNGQRDINNVVTTGQQNIANVVSSGQTAINNVVTKGQTDIGKVVSDGETTINDLKRDKEAEVDQLIEDSRQRFENVIGELEEVATENDIAGVIVDVNTLKGDVNTLKDEAEAIKADNVSMKVNISSAYNKATALEKLTIESDQYPGCFYRIVAENTEWINPPSIPGIEYLTTERWNNNSVYQRTIYAAALPNKTVMSVFVGAYFDEIISITGFAIDSDNNMHYPFPIILNGLTPAAVISYAEGDGGDGSDITINTNEDLSSFKAYITVKYTRKVRE